MVVAVVGLLGTLVPGLVDVAVADAGVSRHVGGSDFQLLLNGR